MMPLMLLDSGAFSVWNRGLHIDIDDYIRFCVQYPEVSYYVNLDVIPGAPGQACRPDDVQKACVASWNNYQKMLETLPFDKVVPVFHQNDKYDWLEKYIEFGTPYIGISPANDRTTDQRMEWLREVKRYIFDSQDQPLIKTHGFAVTSFKLMKFMKWHSVDSASWVRHSAYGTIYVPNQIQDQYVYSRTPILLSVSPKSPARDEADKHYHNLTPSIRRRVDVYLERMNMKLGAYDRVSVPKGYKKVDGELWWDKRKREVLRITEKGVMTSHQQRFWLNMKFIQKANEVLPVDHIYFAGAGGSLIDPIEYRLGRRLMSYHEIIHSKSARAVFEKHLELMKNV